MSEGPCEGEIEMVELPHLSVSEESQELAQVTKDAEVCLLSGEEVQASQAHEEKQEFVISTMRAKEKGESQAALLQVVSSRSVGQQVTPIIHSSFQHFQGPVFGEAGITSVRLEWFVHQVAIAMPCLACQVVIPVMNHVLINKGSSAQVFPMLEEPLKGMKEEFKTKLAVWFAWLFVLVSGSVYKPTSSKFKWTLTQAEVARRPRVKRPKFASVCPHLRSHSESVYPPLRRYFIQTNAHSTQSSPHFIQQSVVLSKKLSFELPCHFSFDAWCDAVFWS